MDDGHCYKRAGANAWIADELVQALQPVRESSLQMRCRYSSGQFISPIYGCGSRQVWEDTEADALMSFGINTDSQWRLGAKHKILKGAKPADLPVQQRV